MYDSLYTSNFFFFMIEKMRERVSPFSLPCNSYLQKPLPLISAPTSNPTIPHKPNPFILGTRVPLKNKRTLPPKIFLLMFYPIILKKPYHPPPKTSLLFKHPHQSSCLRPKIFPPSHLSPQIWILLSLIRLNKLRVLLT